MFKMFSPQKNFGVFRNWFCLLTTMLFVSACAPKKISLRQTFWENNSSRVGVAMTPVPELDTHLGGLPLLQYGIIHAANSGVRSNLKDKIDGGRFSAVRDRFVKLLNDKGIKAKALPDMVYKKENAQEIAKTNDVDTLILLTVKQWGTLRNYVTILFVPGPIGPPQGFFDVEGKMVSLANGEISWFAFMDIKSAVVPIEEPWDQKDEGFPHVVKAVESAGENAGHFLANEFFGDKVAWEPIDLSSK